MAFHQSSATVRPLGHREVGNGLMQSTREQRQHWPVSFLTVSSSSPGSFVSRQRPFPTLPASCRQRELAVCTAPNAPLPVWCGFLTAGLDTDGACPASVSRHITCCLYGIHKYHHSCLTDIHASCGDHHCVFSGLRLGFSLINKLE